MQARNEIPTVSYNNFRSTDASLFRLKATNFTILGPPIPAGHRGKSPFWDPKHNEDSTFSQSPAYPSVPSNISNSDNSNCNLSRVD